MSAPSWTVHEHIIPASHPRGYRRGVRDPQTSRLKLHVKQYVPNTQPTSSTAITFVVQHGMPPGAIKEAYEPFFWDLISHPKCPPVRAIWALDAAGYGQSFLLNKSEIGDDPHWFDSAEDIRHMINHFQDEMKPPLIGVGHSWGCVAVLMNAARHARLFQSVILSEPVTENGWYHAQDPRRLNGELPQTSGRGTGQGLALRRSRWKSKEEAEQWHSKHKLYQQYSPRVLKQILKYDLQELEDGTVELITPAAQILPMFQRPSPPLDGISESEDYATRILPYSEFNPGFYSALGPVVKQNMPAIHCKVLYVWAMENSFISDDAYRERLVSITGTGMGGGGGRRNGQIEEAFVDGGHNLPLLKPEMTADAVVLWLARAFWPWWLSEESARENEPHIDPVNLPTEVLERLGVTERRTGGKKPKL